MQVMVNPMVCQGHGICATLTPDVFTLDESTRRSQVTVETVPEHLHDAVRHAARSCPEGAIIIAE
jgi:ferredoxin